MTHKYLGTRSSRVYVLIRKHMESKATSNLFNNKWTNNHQRPSARQLFTINSPYVVTTTTMVAHFGFLLLIHMYYCLRF